MCADKLPKDLIKMQILIEGILGGGLRFGISDELLSWCRRRCCWPENLTLSSKVFKDLCYLYARQ